MDTDLSNSNLSICTACQRTSRSADILDPSLARLAAMVASASSQVVLEFGSPKIPACTKIPELVDSGRQSSKATRRQSSAHLRGRWSLDPLGQSPKVHDLAIEVFWRGDYLTESGFDWLRGNHLGADEAGQKDSRNPNSSPNH
jgi:hypothetical protein